MSSVSIGYDNTNLYLGFSRIFHLILTSVLDDRETRQSREANQKKISELEARLEKVEKEKESHATLNGGYVALNKFTTQNDSDAFKHATKILYDLLSPQERLEHLRQLNGVIDKMAELAKNKIKANPSLT